MNAPADPPGFFTDTNVWSPAPVTPAIVPPTIPLPAPAVDPDTSANPGNSDAVVAPPKTGPESEGLASDWFRTVTDHQSPIVRDIERVWGVPFDRLDMSGAINRIGDLIARRVPSLVITANLNYVMLHHRHPDLREITERAALVLADGQPIVWRSSLGGRRLPERVAGSEMIFRLAESARDRGWGIYFLGGEPGVASRCAERLTELYPGLRISGVESPPFRPLSDAEQEEQDSRIRQSGADILLVAFGQPKGEKWIDLHQSRLGIPVAIQLGASFDFVAGTAERAPASWQRFGMEWAYRMLQDPSRLVPRYASNAAFLMKTLVKEASLRRAR